MTECTQAEMRTKAPCGREVVARFDGGEITSDAGGAAARRGRAAADEPLSEVVLDLDATDDPIHGKQEGFFHGYYDYYCYLPLYIFAGDHLLCARLRTANRDGASGSVEELTRIVSRILAAWADTRIIVRADSGFCREWLVARCESEKVHYVLGAARNGRLLAKIESELEKARQLDERTGKPARVFKSLRHRTLKSWSHERLGSITQRWKLAGRANSRRARRQPTCLSG